MVVKVTKSLVVLFWLSLVSLLLVACASKPPLTLGQASVDYDLLLNLPGEKIAYNQRVRPILDSRCVVCHGCYDAPCQLKLSSYEGVQRGASPVKVYDGARFKAIAPTRLGIDARGVAQWREKGFHPVLAEETQRGDALQNLQQSVMYRMLRLKQRNPQPRVGMVSDDVDVSPDRKQVCTGNAGFDDFARRHPQWGMPYAMPNLSDAEYATLVQWLAQGAPGPDVLPPSPEAAAQIRRWEAFLNGEGNKQRLVSRYLYEHLFQAHIHFHGTSTREFYRLVVSRTPPGQAVDEIPLIRPFDDPGPVFYYRLLRYQPSIVSKMHNVYEWSDARLRRYRALFLQPDYRVDELPGYGIGQAANPFAVFAAIPPVSRYRFMLDDARFFIQGFIKGPVCRGQIALNVIEDHFWVFFASPDPDILTLQPEFLASSAGYLNLPAERGDNSLRVLSTWQEFLVLQQEYLATRNVFLQEYFAGKPAALPIEEALDFIWDGNGSNPNAALTVFRHFDSASVSWGLVGDYPDTSWILDYPLLERIHYLLVAGFNIYGNMTHQLTTRLYMDFLRMEAENYFLLYMPVEARTAIRDRWYTGMHAWVKDDFEEAQAVMMALNTVTGYRSDDPQREFYGILQAWLGDTIAGLDDLHHCRSAACMGDVTSVPGRVDNAMRRIAQLRGDITNVVPDLAFVRVRDDKGDGLAYTIILNKGYTNITSMFADEDRRDVSQDTLTVVRGLTGAYPNFFFDVAAADIEDFVSRFEQIRNRDDYERFVALYGVRRTSRAFWPLSDWFRQKALADAPLEAGIFDLNRYQNR